MLSYGLERKEAFEDDENVNFFKCKTMVLVKKSTIFSSLFFSKIGLEIMLSYGLKRKKAFEEDKNVNF